MNRETMRRLVCRFAYGIAYHPDTFRKTDWKEMLYRYEHEPGGKTIRLVNESKVNFIRQEYVLLQDTMELLKELMLVLETKHEKWLEDHNEVFRYRDYRSIEGKPMLEGPAGNPIEDWLGYFYNNMSSYKSYMEKELGKAVKGDTGEERVADILDKSSYAEYTVHNVVLDVADEGGDTNEIDTFVILPCGVAVLEVKNYGKLGQTLMVTDSPQWDLYEKGRKIGQRKNPAYQNKRHARATILTLKKFSGKDIPVFPLTVIGNNAVSLKKSRNPEVRNIDDFVPYLDSLKSSQYFSEEERKKIRRFLEQEDIGSNAFAMISYREQIIHIKEIVKEVSMAASFNQCGKVLYYKIQDIVSWLLIGLIAAVLIGGAAVLHNLDSFMVFLVGLCLVITMSAGAVYVGKKIMSIVRK